MNKNIWGHKLDDVSIDFLREMCPPEGYYVAFSGGKDSVVILDLVNRAGVAHDSHYNITCVDPPELVQFIKREHPEVERHPPTKSMWTLIQREGLPTRQMRHCCRHLKERGGIGRVVVTGIRAQESVARKTRGPVERSRRHASKTFVHPILNWRGGDVWQYIRERNIPYCHLYDEGFRRLGCVVCPFNREVARGMRRWPKLFAAARRALQRGWDDPTVGAYSKARTKFPDAEAFWEWWLSRDEPYPEPQRECGGLFV